jgi:hypothetical protein
LADFGGLSGMLMWGMVTGLSQKYLLQRKLLSSALSWVQVYRAVFGSKGVHLLAYLALIDRQLDQQVQGSSRSRTLGGHAESVGPVADNFKRQDSSCAVNANVS